MSGDMRRFVLATLVVVAAAAALWWFAFDSGLTAPAGFVYAQY